MCTPQGEKYGVFLSPLSGNVCVIFAYFRRDVEVLMAPSFWILTAMVFVFTYVNGFHDGCNVVATLIASRAMKPHPALAWAAVVEVLSPFAMLIVGSSLSYSIT